jgi:hypothetical protein
MADLAGFVTAVHRQFGMRPVLPLEFPIEIGDIGTIGNDGVWHPITTVRHSFNGFPGRVQRTADGRVWEACSDDVSFELFRRGETSGLIPVAAHAKARTEISFGSPGAFVLAARGVTIRIANDLEGLIDKIHLAYHTRRQRPEEGRWWRDYRFVLAVADAERFTAMLPTNGSEARVAITPKGTSGPPSSPAKLASLVRFGPGSEDFERTNQRDARGRFYRAYRLRSEVLERWREEPWTRSRGVITFAWPTPSFAETFAEV